jgi:hypothetical protein
MSKLLPSVCIGALAGLVDVTPMVMRHADWSVVLSAFAHWIVVGVLVAYVQIPQPPWMKGVLVAVATALPTVVERTSHNLQSAFGILAMSIVLGAVIGWANAKWIR